MRQHAFGLTLAALVSASVGLALAAHDRGEPIAPAAISGEVRDTSVQLGPRPFFLVNDMEDSRLKRELLSCSDGPFKKTDFSIGHRGAALQFPEHTRESYEAGARMGAGILECDVTFTKDKELVCRHAQNDLPRPRTSSSRRWPASASSRSRRPCSDPMAAHHAGVGRVPHQRHHAGRVQDPDGQDGRLQPARADAAGVPRRHAELPDRFLGRPDQRAPPDPQGEHRAVQEARREDDARAARAPA